MVTIVSRLVEVCVFAHPDTGPEFLLLRRSPSEKVYPGLWQFVTGALEGAEKAVDAALRELEEETGLRPVHFWTVPHVSVFYDAPRDSMNLCPVFAARVDPRGAPKLSAEHSEYLWCGYDDAVRTLVWPGQRESLRIVRDFIAGGEPAAALLQLF